jgi:sugar phosphate isomerase/epimerase
MDPVATLRRYWDRTDYIHFKDIDPAVFDEVMGERIRFFDACARASCARSGGAASTIARSAGC